MLEYLADPSLLFLSNYWYRASRLKRPLCALRQSAVHDSTFTCSIGGDYLFLETGLLFQAGLDKYDRLRIASIETPRPGPFIDMHYAYYHFSLVALEGYALVGFQGQMVNSTAIYSPMAGQKIIAAAFDLFSQTHPWVLLLSNGSLWCTDIDGNAELVATPVPITGLRSGLDDPFIFLLGADGDAYCYGYPQFRLHSVLDIRASTTRRSYHCTHQNEIIVLFTSGVTRRYQGSASQGCFRLIEEDLERKPLHDPRIHRTEDGELLAVFSQRGRKVRYLIETGSAGRESESESVPSARRD